MEVHGNFGISWDSHGISWDFMGVHRLGYTVLAILNEIIELGKNLITPGVPHFLPTNGSGFPADIP